MAYVVKAEGPLPLIKSPNWDPSAVIRWLKNGDTGETDKTTQTGLGRNGSSCSYTRLIAKNVETGWVESAYLQIGF